MTWGGVTVGSEAHEHTVPETEGKAGRMGEECRHVAKKTHSLKQILQKLLQDKIFRLF